MSINKLFFSSLLLLFVYTLNAQTKILFDATKAESAGNADWVIDADQHNLGWSNGPAVLVGGNESNAQRIPNPAQSNVTQSTAETYWQGGISAWGIEMVQQGYWVESLPYNGQITYGNSSNVQDLSNYNVFVVCEPNIMFTTAEKTAIMQFVQNGGGLFMVGDHDNSDRNNDGDDSPHIWNDLMSTNSVQSNPFGMSFDYVDFSQTTTNIPNLPTDPLLHGIMGDVTKAQWSGGTSITMSPTANSTVKGVVYKTGSSFGNSNVMVAYATYGSGKVVGFGDSSPCDDGSGDNNDVLYDGWVADASGNHRKLILNATIWLATSSALPPTVNTLAATAITPLSATLNGTINPNGVSTTYYFEWGSTTGYGNATTTTAAGSGSSATPVSSGITGLTAGTIYHYRLVAISSAGTSNGSDMQFTTSTALPTVTTATTSAITISTATSGGNVIYDGGGTISARGVCWSTSVNPVITGSHTNDGNGTGSFVSQVNGLNGGTLYHLRAYATNSAGTSYGDDAPFTTATPVLSATPASQTVSPTAGNFAFSVTSNTSWTATSNAVWCTVTPSGSGNGSLTATFLQNTGGTRNATITLNAIGVTPVDLNLSQLNGELINFPSGFSAANIILNWTDAPGPILPTGYLVRMSSISFSAIVPPVDGVPVADGLNDKNVLYGVQGLTFPNLIPGTAYYFKMYAYCGTGAQIDYKTDGTIPQVQITTAP